MKRNKEISENLLATFAIETLITYADESKIPQRSTMDLSPLEEWLIIKLFESKGKKENEK